jgi:RNA polymerase sigma factor (sigma-70 family)
MQRAVIGHIILYHEDVALPVGNTHPPCQRSGFGVGDAESEAGEGFGRRSSALRSALTRFFGGRGMPAGEIDDLVQDTFLRIVRRGNLSALDSLEAYVFATAQSVLVDRSRRRATRLVDAHVSFHPDVHGGHDLAPDRIIAARETLSATTRALMELPERARQVFVLRRLENMQFAEIAVRLGISVSSAEKDMQRAIRHVVARAGEPA